MYFIEFYYNDKHYYFYFDEHIPVAASKKQMCLDIIKFEFKSFGLPEIDKMKDLLNILNDNLICDTEEHVFQGIFHMLENPVLQGFCGFELSDDDEYDSVLVTINLESNLIYNDDFELSFPVNLSTQ